MEIQTHGYEIEENEHDVVDKVYLDIKPRPQQSEVVQSLKNQAGEEWKSRCTEHYAWKAAEYIIQLEQTVICVKEEKDIMWKSLAQKDRQILELEVNNKFLKGLINNYHLENDAFTGKGNIND
tara:strand:- start:378 stop:746 length:369 start_codon:yes stop_codon:yes gene_type:complete